MNAAETAKEEIRRRSDLVAIAQREGLALRRSGPRWVTRCVFHGEKTASLSIEPDHYHCYGCKAGGDVFSWMMERHDLSFPEALAELAALAGVELPKREAATPRPNFGARDALYGAVEWAALWYRQQLSPATVEYLHRRGVDDATIHAFRLGEAPDGWQGLTHALPDEHRPPARDAGLIALSEKTGRPYDFFRSRLMCPIYTASGRVAGFSGRRLRDPGPGEKDDTPKYLNSPDSAVFSKSSLFLGYHQARPAIRTSKRVLVVEGNVDVLALHAAGYTWAVAPCGTAITADHVELFKRLELAVTLMLDGDKAGRRAAVRALPPLFASGLDVLVVTLEPGEDPADLVVRGGTDAVAEALSRARPAWDVYLEDVLPEPENATAARKGAAFQAELLPVLTQMPAGAVRDLHTRRTAEYLDVSLDQVLSWTGASGSSAAAASAGKKRVITIRENELSRMCTEAEDALVQHHPDLYCRGSMLVEIRPGSTSFVELSKPRLRKLLDSSAAWRLERTITLKNGTEDVKLVPKTVPDPVVDDVFTGRVWERIPALRTITRIPTLRPDGTLLDRPGYDAASQCYYLPSVDVPPVAAAPTPEEALRALETIDDLYEGFEFESDADRSAAHSLLLAAVLRPAMKLCPMYLMDGSTMAVGKGLCADIAGITVTGESLSPVSIYNDEDKTQRGIEASLVAGDPFVFIDDLPIRREVGMKFLDRMLTAGRASVRLHYDNLPTQAGVSALFIMTGNNVRVRSDLVQRCVRVRLTSKSATPQRRTFRIADLRGHVRARRGDIIRAVLTIVRAYLVAGGSLGKAAPPPNRLFTDWDHLARHPLIWLGRPDPLATQDNMAKTSDTEAETWSVFAATWLEVFEVGAMKTAAEIDGQIAEATRYREGRIDPAFELRLVLQGMTRTKLREDPQLIGRLVAGFIGRRHKDYVFQRGARDGRTTYGFRWVGEEETAARISTPLPTEPASAAPLELEPPPERSDDDPGGGSFF